MNPIFTHQYVDKFPEGAIRHIDDLFNAIAEGFTVYSVCQSGHIQEYDFDIDAVLEENYIRTTRPSYDGKSLISVSFFPQDRGVSLTTKDYPPHTCHRSFIDREYAESYSNWMKTDPVYIANVKAFHDSFNWRF